MKKAEFKASVQSQTGYAVIDLRGEINGFAEAELTAAYDKAELENPSSVVLNFSDVDYINSTGIALIVGLMSRARKARRRLVVFGLSDHYLEIFKITRLADFLSIVPDRESAEAFAAQK